ncbi:MAG: transcription termination factor Rho [Actinobacteria bacterium]|nr:MAG: transcription termination factor Rho [Actinomycetota bacterium]
MSTQPETLERSVLERKEREELQTIAGAMGVKASARASKATLIDHILREAGVETADEKPRRARRSAADANGESDAEADVEVAAEGRDGSDGGETGGGDGRAADARATTTVAAGDGTTATDHTSDATTSDATTSDATTSDKAAAADGGTASPGAEVRTGNRQREPRSDRSGGGNQGNQGSQGGQGGGGAQPEPGNRRSRRRRGRDRERGGGGEREFQGGGQEPQYQGEPIDVEGMLDLRDEGYGFLRAGGYLATANDVYVSLSQVRRFALRKGDYLKGASRPAGSNEKYPALLRIDTVNDMTPDDARLRPRFEDLTPLFPDEKLRLEVPGDTNNMVARIVDLISPIGKGQRGLIVSPPKAGKTTVLKQIAHSIEANNPEVHLMVLLVDERPEEVTDMRRSVKGEVVASTFDRPSDEHTQLAELAIDRAKRLVEMGTDVVIVLDGITRLARAYNLAAPASGRILSGGVDSAALYPPKKFFGSARNIEEGGSLTILATALIETGSRMDEVIFEEFKGTGNMELRLDRKLAERRIYPAIDVDGSSTRHEELLFERIQLQQVWKLRRVLNALEGGAGLELLMDKIKTTKSNDEFLAEIAKAPSPAA